MVELVKQKHYVIQSPNRPNGPMLFVDDKNLAELLLSKARSLSDKNEIIHNFRPDFLSSCRNGPVRISRKLNRPKCEPKRAYTDTNLSLLVVSLFSTYLAKANSLFRLKAIQTRSHSPFTASNPRNRNWRKPMTDFMMPKTGSIVLFRFA